MILEDGRKNNRGVPGKAGRKPKAEEQKLIERLTPMEPLAHQALQDALSEGKPWAVKLFFEYLYGKPNQRVQLENVDVQRILPPWMKDEDKP